MIYKKKVLLKKQRNNIFKEKIVNPDYILDQRKFLQILYFYKIFFLFNIYIEDFYFDFFLTKYNIIKNF